MHPHGNGQTSGLADRTADDGVATRGAAALRSPGSPGHKRRVRLRHVIGVMGIAAALPFFVWVPLGWFEAVPSMVDVFGIPGLRYPAGVTIGGLLVAAICFYDA